MADHKNATFQPQLRPSCDPRFPTRSLRTVEERESVEHMPRIHKVAGLRISRLAGRELLPELEPPEVRLEREKSHIFSSDSITLSHKSAVEDVFQRDMRPEHGDLKARLTVYAMNLIVIVFAAPVGLGLLLMNILGGENLRTTAHVVALTGMFLALHEAGALV